MFIVTLFRGIGVVEVGNGLIGLIFLVGFSSFIPQINFLNPIKHLVNRSVPG